MNRRHFLRALTLGAAGAAVPEPIRRYFFAPPGGWGVVRYNPAPTNLPTPNPFRLDPAISMRWIQKFTVETDRLPRLDVLYGLRTVRPDLTIHIAARNRFDSQVQEILFETARKG